MRFTILAGSAAIALAAAGCGAEGRGRTAPQGNGGSAVTSAAPDSLRLELLLQPRVRAGEPVRLELRAENVAPRAVDLYLRGRTPTFDVVIARAGGGVVWRRLEGEIIPAIVGLRALRPGERLQVEATWDQRTNGGEAVEPGDYVVEGSLLTDGEPLRAPPRSLTILGTSR